jgi:hypothetical protein
VGTVVGADGTARVRVGDTGVGCGGFLAATAGGGANRMISGDCAGADSSIHGATDFIATNDAAKRAVVSAAEMPRLHQRESGSF